MNNVTDFYNPLQLGNVLKRLTRRPKWFVLGGPGDGMEAQLARLLWPDCNIIGVEPNDEACKWQLAHGWPRNSYLLKQCLGEDSKDVELVFEKGAVRNASIDPEALANNRGNFKAEYQIVKMTTLDSLDEFYGPFEDAVVWLDIEGSELRALRGAPKLIASGRVMVWNLELMDRVQGMVQHGTALLTKAGYRHVEDWNASPTCRDRIFVREDLL